MRKIIVVNMGLIYSIPPIRSLLEGLSRQNVEVTLVVTKEGIAKDDNLRRKIKVFEIDEYYNTKVSLFKKYNRMLRLRKKLWNCIDGIYDNNTLLWIISDTAVKNLGKKLLDRNYVLHMYELVESKYMVPKYKLVNMHLDIFGRKAKQVVVPEYNRAHLTKVWWKLEKLPFVLENKPFYYEVDESKNLPIRHSARAAAILEEIKDKKIILYQGMLHKERPLDNFISAVERLGQEYALVVMSNDENLYKNCGSINYYYIPYISPPYHLEVTSHAYIGILSYVPTKTSNSILNAVYCAPNKTFEYARFSVPMVSNDVPALDYLFEKFGCGACADINNVDAIYQAIQRISANYDLYSKKAREFYDSVDYERKISMLLDEVTSD